MTHDPCISSEVVLHGVSFDTIFFRCPHQEGVYKRRKSWNKLRKESWGGVITYYFNI